MARDGFSSTQRRRVRAPDPPRPGALAGDRAPQRGAAPAVGHAVGCAARQPRGDHQPRGGAGRDPRDRLRGADGAPEPAAADRLRGATRAAAAAVASLGAFAASSRVDSPQVGRVSAGLREPLWAFAVATALAAALAAMGAVVPFVRDNLHAPIAIIFLYAPAVAARRAGREFDYRDAGLRADPLGAEPGGPGGLLRAHLPAFVAGFFLFYGHVCTIPANALDAPLRRALPPLAGAGGRPPAAAARGSALGASASWWWSPSPRSCSSAAT